MLETSAALKWTRTDANAPISIDGEKESRYNNGMPLRVRERSVIFVLYFMLGFIPSISVAQKLVHPSVISSRGQLLAMKDKVKNSPGSIPYAGWVQMTGSPEAALDYKHTPYATVDWVAAGESPTEEAMRNDAHSARAHALQWVVTGKIEHRDKAITILNDWAKTFQNGTSASASQPRLECAWLLPLWLSAADIIRYYDPADKAWKQSDRDAFQVFIKKLYDLAYQARDGNANWAVSSHLAMLSYAAYRDDKALVESTLAITIAKMKSISEPDGQIQEVCRDVAHPQFSLVCWLGAAELANNLGYPDLYEEKMDGQTTPRLAVILEYFSNMMLGKTDHPCGADWGSTYLGAYKLEDNYEIGYNHYINRKHVTYLPGFKQMVEENWRSQNGSDPHFLKWSELTHGENLALPNTTILFANPGGVTRFGNKASQGLRIYLGGVGHEYPTDKAWPAGLIGYDVKGMLTTQMAPGCYLTPVLNASMPVSR